MHSLTNASEPEQMTSFVSVLSWQQVSRNTGEILVFSPLLGCADADVKVELPASSNHNAVPSGVLSVRSTLPLETMTMSCGVLLILK